MKKIHPFMFLLLSIWTLFAACHGQDQHIFKGTLQNAANLQVTLEEAYFDRTNLEVGKTTCDANGSFEIKLEKPFNEALYRLTVGAKRTFFILDGKETVIELKGDMNNIDRMDFQSTGSATLECYANIIRDVLKTQLKSPEEAKAAAQKGCTPLMQAFMITQFLGSNAAGFLNDFKEAGKMLQEKMPGSKYATDYQNMIAQIEKQMNQQQSAEVIKVGQPAPDISLSGPDGKTHTLSSLKGKVVLLDFWASWCGPCRHENPHVLEMYQKYHDKGFEVFSVSLDGADPRMNLSPEQMKQKEAEGKEHWIAAIKQDGLIWENHVSDLKHWGSAPAATYGVTAIPKTFLIGKDGNIIAVNPRQNLEQELLKVL